MAIKGKTPRTIAVERAGTGRYAAEFDYITVARANNDSVDVCLKVGGRNSVTLSIRLSRNEAAELSDYLRRFAEPGDTPEVDRRFIIGGS